MALKNFGQKLWDWLWRRSPQNASNPKPTDQANQDAAEQTPASNGTTFETYSEMQSIQGFFTKVGCQESGIKTPDGRLSRTRENFALPLGCGHIVCQQQPVDMENQHVRGIAGICHYCLEDLQKSLVHGDITPFDFERLSLVCSDCGKITVSGQLCCPKHYVEVKTSDGSTVYLGPEDMKKQEQKRLVSKVLRPIIDLFLEEGSEMEESESKEEYNEQDTQ